MAQKVSNLALQYKLKIFRHYFPLHYIFTRSPHTSVPESISEPNSEAHQLLDEMPERDVKSATALIGHFAKHGQHNKAIACFSRMLVSDIRPNEYTLGTTIHSSVVLKDLHLGKEIHAYAKKAGLSSNVFVGSSLLDLYVKLSNIDDALQAFKDINGPNVVSYATLIRAYMKEGMFDEADSVFWSMPEKNVVSWNTMISGCSQSGRNEEAVNFFIGMLREGYIPSQFSYPCAIIASANIGALGMGKSIHACSVKILGCFNPGLFLANSLISFYSKCGSMEDGLLVFNKMSERNVVSWNAVIFGFAQNGRGEDAIEMYQEMKVTGFQPNSVTILGLLLACNHVGLVDEGYKYFNEDPSLLRAEHYACMIDLLSRSGRFEEAEGFMRDLPFDPGVGFWKALLGGCQVHSNLELGEVATKRILELDPRDVSSYVMLSNAHSAAGKWGNVLDVRKRMNEKGLARVPGCSWIEIRGNVRVFVTGDKRHRECNEIHMALGFFLEHATNSRVASYLVNVF